MRSGLAEQLLSIALWVLTAVYVVSVLLAGLAQPVGRFDEPLPWVAALQIGRGLVPHSDFWSTYPSLTYWILAGIFSVLGETAVAARSLGMVVFCLLLTAVAAVTRRCFEIPNWRVPYAVLLAALGAGPLFVYAFGLALEASVCTLLVYFLLSRNQSPWRPALTPIAGLMLCVTMLMRINFATYIAVVILLDLIYTGRRRGAGYLFGPMLLGVLVYLLPYRGSLDDVLYQIAIVPQRVFAVTRFIPLPDHPIYYAAIAWPASWFAFRMLVAGLVRPTLLLPLAIAGGMCATAYLTRSNPTLLPGIAVLEITTVVVLDRYLFRLDRFERAFLLTYAMFTHYFLWRADDWHLRPLLTFAGLMIPFLIVPSSWASHRSWPRILAFMLLPLVAVVSWRIHEFRPRWAEIRATAELARRGELMPGISDSARFMRAASSSPLYPDEAELAALRYVYARTGENDCVYVGVSDHAHVFVGDLRAYWLLHRCVGVKRFILEPGVTTDASDQAAMVRDLQRNCVRWVVLAPPVKGDAAFLHANFPGSGLLDEFIAQHYQVAASFGSYLVLQQ